MIAAVLLPTLLIRLRASRFLLAIADTLEPVSGDACLREGLPGSAGALVAQREVVFGRAALIAIALDPHLPVSMLGHHLGGLGKFLLRIRGQFGRIIIEVDVLHALGKDLVVAQRRCGRSGCRCWRSTYGNARGSFLGSARPLGN